MPRRRTVLLNCHQFCSELEQAVQATSIIVARDSLPSAGAPLSGDSLGQKPCESSSLSFPQDRVQCALPGVHYSWCWAEPGPSSGILLDRIDWHLFHHVQWRAGGLGFMVRQESYLVHTLLTHRQACCRSKNKTLVAQGDVCGRGDVEGRRRQKPRVSVLAEEARTSMSRSWL